MVFLLFISCTNETNNTITDSNQGEDFMIGDCYKIQNDFGLILIEIINTDNQFELSFVPVNLDIEREDLEQFVNGKIYQTKRKDIANPLNQIKGFEVIHILNRDDFEFFETDLIKVGNIELNKDQLLITGGSAPITIEQMKLVFTNWDAIYGRDANKIILKKILKE